MPSVSLPSLFSRFLVLLIALFGLGASHGLAGTSPHRRFDWAHDTFAFANDTLWIYNIDQQGRLTMHEREKPPEYSRRCFVMCRAALQFYKFARFEPREPRVSEAEYRRRILSLCYIPVWLPRWGTEVVIPGYRDLRSFSKDHTHLMESIMGNWWPSYFRVGNWRMALPFPRSWQKKLADDLVRTVEEGNVQAVFLTRFRPINHCIIVYHYRKTPEGRIEFAAYDPNDKDHPVTLTFDAATRSFSFPRTAYFNGGRVNAFRAYLAPWQ